MSKPRSAWVEHGIEFREMDIVRGAIGYAVALGASAEDIKNAAFTDGVETLEDFDAVLSASVDLKMLWRCRK